MKIAITGSGGYIGTNIIEKLDQRNFQMSRIDRELLYGDYQSFAEKLKGTDAIINLAGAPVIQRWTRKNRSVIYNSRVQTTQNLVKAINAIKHTYRPRVVVSISAIGIYRDELVHDETSTRYANHFAARVIDNWEDALVELPEDIRRIIFRSGIVIGKNSPFMNRLLPVFKLGIGGKIGDGKQAFPFIHIDDVAQAFEAAISENSYSGIYNLVAPEQISNQEFTKIFAKKLNRPAFFHVPAIALRALYGKAANLIIKSPVVIPQRLKKQNFKFIYPSIEGSLKEILNKKN
ncbi:TIGR01777 family oxidoreductase [uncultured Sunxiuqinia sp.]|uniref:TIGR01777 family oxidoreductase n=1 Tax=uncultured Sunxiuqinia sp. TaxID=1573825 RepID=UPI002AA90F9B|nr:TIGR01777 family oxidoreductase [uncultured Sunxiuqinia sp.]